MPDAIDRPRPTLHLRRPVGWTARTVLAVALALGCGIESREERQARAATESRQIEAAAEWERSQRFEWPRAEGTRAVAVLHVAGYGAIHIALYPELAPVSVDSFRGLAGDGFYDGTTFHRVIPEFMIQGGDPNSLDDDPRNDGFGGPDFRVPDEFSEALHTRGTVSLANTGSPNSSGSQFFIVLADQPHLDGRYNVIGKVIEGMDVVDRITTAERDLLGRWGAQDRPIENIVIERIELTETEDGEQLAGL